MSKLSETQFIVDIRRPTYSGEKIFEPFERNYYFYNKKLLTNTPLIFIYGSFLHDLGHHYQPKCRFNIKDWGLHTLWGGLFEPCIYRKLSEPKRKRIPDYDMRLKLSKLIGLSDIPKPDSNAIQRLSGIIEDKIDSETVDSVELVREIRGS